jgi:two-component system, HptB-dependent secretion and biofilm response regulator
MRSSKARTIIWSSRSAIRCCARKCTRYRARSVCSASSKERNACIEAYRVAEDEQNDIAEKVIRRFALRDLATEKAIDHWINPASLFCGDAVAAARTPAGVLHVLIADGAGHGLAAALSTLPAPQPFYRMTEAGYSLPRMLHEMNDEVCRLLPVERL